MGRVDSGGRSEEGNGSSMDWPSRWRWAADFRELRDGFSGPRLCWLMVALSNRLEHQTGEDAARAFARGGGSREASPALDEPAVSSISIGGQVLVLAETPPRIAAADRHRGTRSVRSC